MKKILLSMSTLLTVILFSALINVSITYAAGTVCSNNCGDCLLTTGSTEACDDGNKVSGDGCNSTCSKIETGWSCIKLNNKSVCTPICGNGIVQTGEACDDGDKTGGDGCSATCTVESNYTCTGSPSVCTATPALPGFTFEMPVFELAQTPFPTLADFDAFLTVPPITLPDNGPTSNPPSANVIPNFSGLVVDGDTNLNGEFIVDSDTDTKADFKIDNGGTIILGNRGKQHIEIWNQVLDILAIISNGLIQINGDWVQINTSLLEIFSLSGTTHIDLNGSLSITGGDLKFIGNADSIGSFYTITQHFVTTTAGYEIPGISCRNYDYITGCTGYGAWDNANDRFEGTYIDGSDVCRAVIHNGGGSADAVDIFARCFDPQGQRTGTNPT